MLDRFARNINYMRISITDRCNLHCRYCRPLLEESVEQGALLSYEELLRAARCAAALGITRFKITGGEPLVRSGAVSFMQRLKQLPDVEQVTLTTNGTLLERYLPELAAAKVDAVNISLDTMNEAAYAELSGGRINTVLQGIAAAKSAGLNIKLNCVPLKQAATPADIRALCEFAAELQIPLRFIELMPLRCNSELAGYSGDEVRAVLQGAGYSLKKLPASLGNGPAQYYEVLGNSQIIGFIEPVHHRFCSSCNRVRLTSTGQLKPCLYSAEVLDVRALLRSAASNEELSRAMQAAIYAKPDGHHFGEAPADFNMNEIGG